MVSDRLREAESGHVQPFGRAQQMRQFVASAVVALMAVLGDFSFREWRLWVCVAIGCAVVIAAYMLALPDELPLWPGVCAVLAAGVVGLFWNDSAAKRERGNWIA